MYKRQVPGVLEYIEKNFELRSYLELFSHELSTPVETSQDIARELTVFHRGNSQNNFSIKKNK